MDAQKKELPVSLSSLFSEKDIAETIGTGGEIRIALCDGWDGLCMQIFENSHRLMTQQTGLVPVRRVEKDPENNTGGVFLHWDHMGCRFLLSYQVKAYPEKNQANERCDLLVTLLEPDVTLSP